MKDENSSWSVERAAELYRIPQWGEGHFSVSQKGDIVARLENEIECQAVSLREIVEEIRGQGITLPVILRFPNILSQRITRIVSAFSDSIKKFSYASSYRGCFPVKANQNRELVSRVVSVGAPHHFGLEVGSKAELIEAISLVKSPEAYLVCNGYKDATYIDIALMALETGLRVRIVLERPYEIPLVIERAQKLGIDPALGIRVRLSKASAGRWAASSGSTGMFGFSISELVSAIDELKRGNRLECLQMLHFHQGSQIPTLSVVKDGLIEACQHYRQLIAEGARLDAINIGGGLAIDYEGTTSESHGSRNYTLSDYCDTVVGTIHNELSPHLESLPDIISESGRAIASHFSVLVMETLENPASACPSSTDQETRVDSFPLLEELRSLVPRIGSDCEDDLYHTAEELGAEAGRDYTQSKISLRQFSQFLQEKDTLERQTCRYTSPLPTESQERCHEIDSEYYYGNFSIFRSLPDAWAIRQAFPILPLHRLDEKPNRNAVLADITCDCDGAIRKYYTLDVSTHTLPLHPLRPGEPYYLAAFLVGSYQETLGDIHNLFGAPAIINVRIDQGEIVTETISTSESIASILGQVKFSETHLFDGFIDLANEALESGLISEERHTEMVHFFGTTLNSPTYLQSLVPLPPSSSHESGQRVHQSSLPAL